MHTSHLSISTSLLCAALIVSVGCTVGDLEQQSGPTGTTPIEPDSSNTVRDQGGSQDVDMTRPDLSVSNDMAVLDQGVVMPDMTTAQDLATSMEDMAQEMPDMPQEQDLSPPDLGPPCVDIDLRGRVLNEMNYSASPLKIERLGRLAVVELLAKTRQDIGPEALYTWSITRQVRGSDPLLRLEGDAGGDDRAQNSVQVDRAGTYSVQVDVTPTMGRVSCGPKDFTFEVVSQPLPPRSIFVEVVWEAEDANGELFQGVDFDLYYLEQRAMGDWGDEDWSVNWRQTQPNWGTMAVDDDPELFQESRGPLDGREALLHTPSSSPNMYSIGVYYYPLPVPPADIKVKVKAIVWNNGRPQLSLMRDDIKPGDMWYLTDVSWPARQLFAKDRVIDDYIFNDFKPRP